MAEEQSTCCANHCGFYGNPATMNLCSKCYAHHQQSKAKASPLCANNCGFSGDPATLNLCSTSYSASKTASSPGYGYEIPADVGKKKRERDGEIVDVGGDEEGHQKKIITAVDKIQAMSTAIKKQLIDRLLRKADKEDGVSDKNQKLVTATKKGSTLLDRWVPDEIKNNYHVLQVGDEIYDAMLSLADVEDNSNRFYVLQVLEMDSGGTLMVYSRWGRVGDKGTVKLFGPYTSREMAIQEFESKFHSMTKNLWCNRKGFISYPKNYTWLEMAEVKPCSSITMQPRGTSKLDTRVASFVSLICNVGMMKQQMTEIGYNAEKLPLGKLSKSTILKGYDVLKRISDIIGQANTNELEQLSGEFYTVIPHNIGYKNMREFVIDTPEKLKSKLQMVEALGEIELATKLLKEDIGTEDDSLFSSYKRLGCDLMPLEADSEESLMVVKYLMNTNPQNHSIYTVDVVQVFRLSREGETERFNKYSTTKNRMLLWHGSRLSNWAGILSQGLRISPPEAPKSGKDSFGNGVYFSDTFAKSAYYCYAFAHMHSKSANYDNSIKSSRSGVLLLCEVALGDMQELQAGNPNANQLPVGKLSTKGVGRTAPDPKEAQTLKDGVVVPLGKLAAQKGALMYNEYIVYNVDQVRMRYLLQVNFKYNLSPGSRLAQALSNRRPGSSLSQPQLPGSGLSQPLSYSLQPLSNQLPRSTLSQQPMSNQLPGSRSSQLLSNQLTGSGLSQPPSYKVSGSRLSQPLSNQLPGPSVPNQLQGSSLSQPFSNQLAGSTLSQPLSNQLSGSRLSQPLSNQLPGSIKSQPLSIQSNKNVGK